MDFIDELEKAFGKRVGKIFLPMQPGGIFQTDADTSRHVSNMGYSPH